MSTNQTASYQLHLWEPGDNFLREEFNENTLAIEAALGEKAEVVFGSYTGDNTANRVISLGFTPKAVILANNRGRLPTGMDTDGGICLPGLDETNLKLVDGGFQVSNVENYGGSTNNVAAHYYIAFR